MRDRIRKINYKPVLLSVLLGVGGLLMAFGLGAFFIGGLFSQCIKYDHTQTLSKPMPICSYTDVVYLNQRLYVLQKYQCALDVFEEDGTFLFCVRCETSVSGGPKMRITEEDIYIDSPHGILHRFDQTGTYRGYAINGCIYDRDGNFVDVYHGPIWTFTDDWYSFEMYDPKTEHRDIFIYSYRGDILAMETPVEGDNRSEDGAEYYTFLNGLYRKQDGETVLLAKTPLYLTFWYSPPLGLLCCVIGVLIWKAAYPPFKAAAEERKKEKSEDGEMSPE